MLFTLQLLFDTCLLHHFNKLSQSVSLSVSISISGIEANLNVALPTYSCLLQRTQLSRSAGFPPGHLVMT